ncbi:WD40-repeat-containing domain protein [Suillus cothurnatus]|nr:WD40-repeat-containing domain protein [Suillus cothurnatus]
MASQPTPLSPLTLVTEKTTSSECVTQHSTKRITRLSQTFEGHHDFISVVAVLPNTQRMVTSSKDKTLYLSDLTTKKVLKPSCDITGGIIPWNGKSGVCVINDHARGGGFTRTKFTPQFENGWFTTAQNGSAARTNDSVALYLITAHQSNEVHMSLDFSADGSILASAGDRMVKFWCTAKWKEKDIIPLDAAVHCIRYSSSGERLAIATENNICIYNPATRQHIKMLMGHSGGTFTLTWAPQGIYLLSGGSKHDPTIRVWDALRGNEIDTFHGHTDKINAISVNDSSTIITSASCDGSVRFWPFPKSNILEVSATALCVTCFGGGDDRKISQSVLPSTGLMSTMTQVKTCTLTLIMDEIAYIVLSTVGGKLSTALEIFTRQIEADSNNYIYFGHRSIVNARMHDWECALKDAIQAIAIFNTNAHEEAVMSVNDMAEESLGSDLLACKVVQIYFFAEMALAASKDNIRDKAIQYIDAAIEIANSCSLHTIDLSVYTAFVVIFGWDLKSLWRTIEKYKCLILLRTCNIEVLEYYRLLMNPCNEVQKASLRAWFALLNYLSLRIQACRVYVVSPEASSDDTLKTEGLSCIYLAFLTRQYSHIMSPSPPSTTNVLCAHDNGHVYSTCALYRRLVEATPWAQGQLEEQHKST